MQIVEPSVQVVGEIDANHILTTLERIGRTCYKSEHKIGPDTAEPFIRKILMAGHGESVIEHITLTVRVVCDRGVSHEIVRHRVGSYSQESTRYCDYGDKGIRVIMPPAIRTFYDAICSLPDQEIDNHTDLQRARDIYTSWRDAIKGCEKAYMDLRSHNVSPQIARSVLPHALATEIVITYNLREWRHFFRLRIAINAHPQMRQVANQILEIFRTALPVIFESGI
jgi:thymidylate synthase (FAD)